MTTVVPMPTGRDRKRRLRQATHEAPDTRQQDTAPKKVRRHWIKATGRRLLGVGLFMTRLLAHFTLAGSAVLLTLASRMVFFFALLAFIALAALTLIELARNWQDMGVFVPMAEATGVLIGVYIVAEVLVQGIRHLQYRVHP